MKDERTSENMDVGSVGGEDVVLWDMYSVSAGSKGEATEREKTHVSELAGEVQVRFDALENARACREEES